MNLLEKAAEILEVEGWGQQELHADERTMGGPHCVLGALEKAAGLNPLDIYFDVDFHDEISGEVVAARNALALETIDRYGRRASCVGGGGRGPEQIYYTNDTYLASEHEAIELLKHAAKRLDSGS